MGAHAWYRSVCDEHTIFPSQQSTAQFIWQSTQQSTPQFAWQSTPQSTPQSTSLCAAFAS